ncbi:hypothetical protein [Flavobacterium psychrotrophum]|uniref:hypothetical protein n=1 Tax=Flavobacterium psychrotrophum TaxID=2294119 RepID=UPI000E320E03|nr:hypothetical protein [Flavobacterium psychrotrophum]
MKDFKIDEEDKMKTGFRVPEGYFDVFTERMMTQIAEQPEPKVLPLYRHMPVWFSAAAAFILLLGAGWFFMLNNQKTAQPDDVTIENYLVYNSNVSTYDLTQQLNEQDIKQLESSLTINDDAVEDYLLDENIYE